MIELLRTRRTIRSYDNRSIPESVVEELKEAAVRAPTSRDRKEWKFWFVTDRAQLAQLAHAKSSGSKMIDSAPLAIVIGAKESECDVWVEDCSIAAILLQLTAQNHGIGSVWVQIRKRFTASGSHSEDCVKSALGVNDPDIRIASIIALGYPVKPRIPLTHDQLKWDAIQ